MPDPDETDRLSPRPAIAGKWLAVETSGLYGSVAAAEVDRDGCRGLALRSLPRDSRSAQSLAPALHGLLGELSWPAAEVVAVAVVVGPGSFTGLRVGVATVKAFAYATDAAVIGVDTLDVLAEATPIPTGATDLWAAIDAQRSELFAARFEPQDGRWSRTGPTQRRTRAALLDSLLGGEVVAGPLAEQLVGDRTDVVTETAEPLADAALRVARRSWLAGVADNVFALAPRYHRLSAAEEKLSERKV